MHVMLGVTIRNLVDFEHFLFNEINTSIEASIKQLLQQQQQQCETKKTYSLADTGPCNDTFHFNVFIDT